MRQKNSLSAPWKGRTERTELRPTFWGDFFCTEGLRLPVPLAGHSAERTCGPSYFLGGFLGGKKQRGCIFLFRWRGLHSGLVFSRTELRSVLFFLGIF